MALLKKLIALKVAEREEEQAAFTKAPAQTVISPPPPPPPPPQQGPHNGCCGAAAAADDQDKPGGGGGAVPPAVWLIVWVGAACEWLRGYISAFYYGARDVLTPEGLPAILPTQFDERTEPLSLAAAALGCARPVGTRAGFAAAAPDGALGPWNLALELGLPPLGALAAGWLARSAGRRAAAGAGLDLMSAGMICGGLAGSPSLYYAGYSLFTAGSVMTLQAMLLQNAEAAPPHARGRLISLGAAAGLLGYLMADVVVYAIKLSASWEAAGKKGTWRFGFRLSLLLGLWPTALLMAVLPFMLESPASLLQRGRPDAARQVLQTLRGELADVRAEFEGMLRAADVGSRGRGGSGGGGARGEVALMLKRRQLPGTIMAVLLALLGAWIDPFWLLESDVNFAAPNAFAVAGGHGPYLCTRVLPALAYLLGASAAVVLCDRTGRRRLMAWCGAAMSVAAAALSAAVAAAPAGGLAPAAEAALYALFLLVIVLATMGWTTTHFIVAVELQPLSVRSAATSLHVGTFFLAYRSLKQAASYLGCGAWARALGTMSGGGAAAALFAFLLLPETGGCALEDVVATRTLATKAWRRFNDPVLPTAAAAGGASTRAGSTAGASMRGARPNVQ